MSSNWIYRIPALLVVGCLATSCARNPSEAGARFLSTGKSLAGNREYHKALLEFKNADRSCRGRPKFNIRSV
jgi:hypothetical protein